jgi:hypothetical protein
MIANRRWFRVSQANGKSAGAALVSTSLLSLLSLLSLASAGCSSTPPATPRAAVASELGQGSESGAAMMCPHGVGLSWIAIGSDTSDPITSGTSYNGGPVSVSCSVHSTGDSFSVTLSALLGGQGSISVVNSTINSDTTQVSMGITSNFERGDTGDFKESDCTWDFGGQSTDIDPAKTAGNPLGIAPGRIWGNLTCPMMIDSEHNQTCLGQAELRFENCGQ